jgi:chromosome segregation ATPase
VKDLQDSIKKLLLELNKTKSDLDRLHAINEELQTDVEQLQESKKQNQEENDELNIQVEKLQSENQELKEKQKKEEFVSIFRYFLRPEAQRLHKVIDPSEETEAMMNAVQVRCHGCTNSHNFIVDDFPLSGALPLSQLCRFPHYPNSQKSHRISQRICRHSPFI